MLKAIIFDMDDTLVDWSQRSQDWREYERQHLQLVFNYIAQEVHPVTLLDEFCEAALRLYRDAWLDSGRGLRAPHRGKVMSQALESIGVPANLINFKACFPPHHFHPAPGVAPYSHPRRTLP